MLVVHIYTVWGYEADAEGGFHQPNGKIVYGAVDTHLLSLKELNNKASFHAESFIMCELSKCSRGAAAATLARWLAAGCPPGPSRPGRLEAPWRWLGRGGPGRGLDTPPWAQERDGMARGKD